MGIMDAFSKEDRVDVTFSTFYEMVKGCTERDMLKNAVKCDMPYRFIREMISGEKEEPEKELIVSLPIDKVEPVVLERRSSGSIMPQELAVERALRQKNIQERGMGNE